MFDADGELNVDALFDSAAADRHYQRKADAVRDFGEEPGAGKRLGKIGKRDFRAMQRQKEPLAQGLDFICMPDRALALRNCCNRIIRHRYEDGDVVETPAECNDRLCPTGESRRARRLAASITKQVDRFLRKNPGMQCAMLTLSGGRTVPSRQLAAQVDKVIKACGELMQRAKIKRVVEAWVRSLELTRNAQTKEWNVHAHLLIFFDAAGGYFRIGNKNYLSTDDWADHWQKQLKLDYRPVIDIRKANVSSPLDDDGHKTLREIIKYPLKHTTLVTMQRGVPVLVGMNSTELYDDGDGQGLREMRCVPLRAICAALKNRRLVATSRNLQGEDDLDFTDDPDADAKAARAKLGRFICSEFYIWREYGRDGDFYLVGRSFDEPKNGGFAMPP